MPAVRTRFDINYDPAKQRLIVKCNFPKSERQAGASNTSKIYFGIKAMKRMRLLQIAAQEDHDKGNAEGVHFQSEVERIIMEDFHVGASHISTADMDKIINPPASPIAAIFQSLGAMPDLSVITKPAVM